MIDNEQDLKELFNTEEFQNNGKLFLGGGSNTLFTKDFEGLVILNKLKGVEILSEDPETVTVRAMGGENWNDLVNFVTERNLWGIENLALVPGTVGAAPMQNIGAYGVELKDVLQNVEAFDVETGKENKKKVFSGTECELGYRDSIFKNRLKEKYFITAITIKLSKTPKPNLSYKILAEYLKNNPPSAHSGGGGEVKNSKDISDAVGAIRKSKLPDPVVIPNAGSFFKNLFVEPLKLEKLQKIYPEMPHFDEGGIVKIPAGWLIEQTGWKGKRLGNVGVHDKQALVLVNYGGADGQEILTLANKIIDDVKAKFGLELVPEVNIV